MMSGQGVQKGPDTQPVTAEVSPGAATYADSQDTIGNDAIQQQMRSLIDQHASDYEEAVFVCEDLGPLSTDERFVYGLRAEINAAGTSDVSPGLIAAVLANENHLRDAWDSVQDVEAQFIIWYEGLMEDFEVAAWGTVTGKPVQEQTFGAAQAQPQVVEELVNGGYITPPAGWTGNELDCSLEMLIDDTQAPMIVAGRLQQTVDHWRSGGMDIGGRADILGTLYSIGLQGSSGVHDAPQPNERGTAIANSIPRLECILAMP
jgi:hypothetical protein